MNEAPPPGTDRRLVPRRLFDPAAALLRRFVARSPRPVQRVAVAALHRLLRRWPLLQQLLDLDPMAERGVPGGPPSAVPPGPGEADTQALVAALRDPAADVAVLAADALRAHPPHLAVPALLEVLDDGGRYFAPATRATAARSLGVLLPAWQGARLAAAVADADAEVSLAAIAALVDRGDRCAGDALLGVLEDRRGFFLPLTRQAAARGLARVRVVDAARLEAALARESDAVVRGALSDVASAGARTDAG
jgi:hypothetical protein